MQADKPTLQKTSLILFVTNNNKLLLQRMEHQGGEVHDVFGTFYSDGMSIKEAIAKLSQEKFGTTLEFTSFGGALEHIEKPDAFVDLYVKAYKAVIDDGQKATLQMSERYYWASKAEIYSDIQIRLGDRLLYARALDERSLDVEMTETQLGAWIDAGLTKYEDK